MEFGMLNVFITAASQMQMLAHETISLDKLLYDALKM